MMLTATGYCSQRLATDFGIDAPTAQSFLNYALLSLHGIPRWLRRWRRARTGSRAADETAPGAEAAESALAGARLRPWQWLLLALADVEANYLLTLTLTPTPTPTLTLTLTLTLTSR